MSQETWQIDTSHTDASFSVRHMGIANVKGHFEKTTGTVTFEGDKLVSAQASIDAASIKTRDDNRDNHLRSADFLDVENYPELTFRSTKVTEQGNGRYTVEGELTIRGTTRPVTLEAEVTPVITDPWGNQRRAITAETSINRKDWGLTWNTILDSGALLVGEKVTIHIEAEVVKSA